MNLLRLGLAAPVLAAFVMVGCGEPEPTDSIDESTQALETFPNEQPAFDYFVGKGLTDEQSAGIVGNLDVESGVDPTVKQSSGGPGRGIAQWTAGARWDTTNGDNVVDYAAQQGKSATSLGLQLDFIWFELTTFDDYGLDHLQAATSVSTAAAAFARYYEGCPSCSSALRVQYGNSVLERFGGGNGGGGSSSSGEPTEPCVVTTTGESGECLSTAACAALGDYVSTPGFCPGADDVQCCTAVDPGPTTSSSGGSSGATGTSGAPGSSGTAAGGGAGTSGSSGRDGADGTDSGGCSTSSQAPAGSAGWLVGALLVLGARRRLFAQ